MPPQKRTSAKQSSKPSPSEVEAAVEKSAEHLEQQDAPPTDVHPKPTTPSKAEVQAAVEKSAQTLETSGQSVATESRNVVMDAAPVSAGGTSSVPDSAPASGSRDKSMDASPVYSAPTPDKPQD